jgi:putative tryptophan/tyrosine transport system substrate-binding protein
MLRSLLTFALFFLLIPQVWAGQIALILSDDSAPYLEFAGSLQKNLKSGWKLAYTDKKLRASDRYPVDLIITAGSGALRSTLASGSKVPILATLLPEYSYQDILLEASSAPLVSAIYLDQPAARQARLMRLLLPDIRRVGLLVSEQSSQKIPLFRSALPTEQLKLLTEHVDSEEQILPALESLLGSADVLLALPDALVYSRSSIRPILITAYRFQRPVIGFSAALVKAGALAALYSTPAQIGRQAGALVSVHGNRLPPPRGPSEYSLTINQSVADAFGLRLPEESDLFQKLLTSGTEE